MSDAPQRDGPSTDHASLVAVAERVRRTCVDEALRAYEDAKIRGLCDDGAWECAVSAMRMVDVEALVRPGEGR